MEHRMNRMKMRPAAAVSLGMGLLLAGAVAVGPAGCVKPKLIPNTKVLDTPVNREILRVMEKYRLAVMRGDAAAVLALVHPTYLDNAGTPGGSDDIDFAGLKKLLRTRYRNTDKIHLRIEYLAVRTRGRQAQVDTWVDATFVYMKPGMKPRWQRHTDANRFRLINDNGSWRFISGL